MRIFLRWFVVFAPAMLLMIVLCVPLFAQESEHPKADNKPIPGTPSPWTAETVAGRAQLYPFDRSEVGTATVSMSSPTQGCDKSRHCTTFVPVPGTIMQWDFTPLNDQRSAFLINKGYADQYVCYELVVDHASRECKIPIAPVTGTIHSQNTNYTLAAQLGEGDPKATGVVHFWNGKEDDPRDDICPDAITYYQLGDTRTGSLEFAGDQDWQKVNVGAIGQNGVRVHLAMDPSYDYELEVRSVDLEATSDECAKMLYRSEDFHTPGEANAPEEVTLWGLTPNSNLRIHVYEYDEKKDGADLHVSGNYVISTAVVSRPGGTITPDSGNPRWGSIQSSGQQEWTLIEPNTTGRMFLVVEPTERSIVRHGPLCNSYDLDLDVLSSYGDGASVKNTSFITRPLGERMLFTVRPKETYLTRVYGKTADDYCQDQGFSGYFEAVSFANFNRLFKDGAISATLGISEPGAPAGVFTVKVPFTYTATGTDPNYVVRNLSFDVVLLNGGNVMLNKDGPKTGDDSVMVSIPNIDLPPFKYANDTKVPGLVSGQTFTATFRIGLQQVTTFSLWVDIYGIMSDDKGMKVINPSVVEASDLAPSFKFDLAPQALQPTPAKLYLPVLHR